jgi:uncharacterized protein (DUF952 family)
MIYKILRRREWEEAQAKGVFSGSADDIRDGFLHFSAAHQVRATYDKYFAAESDLVLLAVEEVKLGEALKWEVSRGGAEFPHLYAALSLQSVDWIKDICVNAEGRAIFPDSIP